MKVRSICLVVLSFWALNAYASPIFVDLGTASTFAVLAGSAVTNTGPTNVYGNLGVSPGTASTGFPPGNVTGGTIHAGDATAMQAQIDLTTAYNFAVGATCGTGLAGDLGGVTVTSGVYCFPGAAGLTGTLTLDAQGDPDAVFLFQLGGALTTAASSAVVFTNGGKGNRLFWQINGAATLGANTAFAGSILALSAITLGAGANIPCGRALARDGAMTMATNNVSIGTPGCEANGGGAIPEPGTATLLGMGLLFCLIGYGRIRGSRRREISTSRGIKNRSALAP